jgi:hypothetical protein
LSPFFDEPILLAILIEDYDVLSFPCSFALSGFDWLSFGLLLENVQKINSHCEVGV